MRRAIFTLGFAGVLVVTVWRFTEAAAPLSVSRDFRPSAAGETLQIGQLGPSERVAIVYRSVGCFHRIERLYQIDGGSVPQFGARQLKLETAAGEPAPASHVSPLSATDAVGLDSYLLFLRHGFAGGCTTAETLVVGYYRDGQKIGEERFRDASCLAECSQDEVVPEQIERSSFPLEVFRAIVTPRQLEERELRLNRPPGE